jgi:hypothetical protein
LPFCDALSQFLNVLHVTSASTAGAGSDPIRRHGENRRRFQSVAGRYRLNFGVLCPKTAARVSSMLVSSPTIAGVRYSEIELGSNPLKSAMRRCSRSMPFRISEGLRIRSSGCVGTERRAIGHASIMASPSAPARQAGGWLHLYGASALAKTGGGVADFLPCVDVNPDRHWSLLSFLRPQ